MAQRAITLHAAKPQNVTKRSTGPFLGAVSLLMLLLSLPAPAPAVGGSVVRAPVSQPVTVAPPAPPPSKHTGTPSLHLTWALPETHAGVPVGLSIQALTAGGQADAARTGTLQ